MISAHIISEDTHFMITLYDNFLKCLCVSPCCLSLTQQTCAVCLEDFKVKDELGVLPCQHAFHRKWVQGSTAESVFALVTTLHLPGLVKNENVHVWSEARWSGIIRSIRSIGWVLHCGSSYSTVLTFIHSWFFLFSMREEWSGRVSQHASCWKDPVSDFNEKLQNNELVS